MKYSGLDTNGKQRKIASQWRADFLGDGWVERQTYPGSKTQPDCFSYDKEGWKASIYNYPIPKGHHVHICAWGPDGVAIDLPERYDWGEFQKRLNVCQYCGETVKKTVRLGFAGRACPECRTKLAPKVEYPGWTN